MNFEERIKKILEARKVKQEYRQLSHHSYPIDFTSNDYLGLSRSAWIKNKVAESCQNNDVKNGSTGSRLLSGNSKFMEALEAKIADFHHAESALIFNSGFDANLGLISTICRGENDVIIYDELVHASIRQGMKLSGVICIPFKHNNVSDLEAKLDQNSFANCFVIVESIYSMDGDKALLKEIANLKEKYPYELIVDEAHALGIFGNQGRGLCNEAKIEADCLARVYTFGKAMGSHGAAIVGSKLLTEYLVNFCKPFIYSTAPSDHNLWSVEHSYNFILSDDIQVVRLFKLINYFKLVFQAQKSIKIIGEGPIFGLQIGNPERTRAVAKILNEHGFDIRPIVYPTVARGSERLRICLHSYNTESEIDLLSEVLRDMKL
ncbi:MAG: pyridoxal phosphate-dependent aminotransferase family protein [Chitinophagales bacterium]